MRGWWGGRGFGVWEGEMEDRNRAEEGEVQSRDLGLRDDGAIR